MTATQCKSACDATLSDLNSCKDANCLCTNQNGKELNKCVDCLVKATGSGISTSVGQETLDSKLLDFVRASADMILMSHA
jgi:hypothetical protein